MGLCKVWMGGGTSLQAVRDGKTFEVRSWDWDWQRWTILCSATIREDVQKLAGTMLIQPLVIKGLDNEKAEDSSASKHGDETATSGTENFTPPSQLSQKYVIVPLKMRPCPLLRSLLARTQGQKGSKVIVFLSCIDSVDFHWRLLGDSSMDGEKTESSGPGEDKSDDEDDKADEDESEIAVQSSLLPGASIFRLHGSLHIPIRLASLRGFSAIPSSKSKTPASASSILLCTSVASRGLGLPLVRAFAQSYSTTCPLKAAQLKKSDGDKVNITLEGESIESVLAKGLSGKGSEYEVRATEVQLPFERVFKGRGSRPAKTTTQHDVGDAEQRMQDIVRAQGRLSKKDGRMISSGTNEFQIASGVTLDSLVHSYRL
ncbi:hypothetical protein DFJ58DRAFT_913785 [Suillus subalutaceus]|uniref:uncharacterized protein n=1 Tax=Suillus subalutaceus TaxID=48586 RepID=UPI001B85B5AA|nr:uncharacterized protein DFJ58DRAFT_913785 [Suillus subalutaceus]KAG1855725.1 hypothetical protein DFJ58DRAFT_913785 [Suillus subalutaceus]